jgi:hypothetical protein
VWCNLARGALKFAEHHERNRDPVPRDANLAIAVLQLAHARCAREGVWVLNEKGLVRRAGLGHLSLAAPGAIAAAVEAECTT